MQPLLRKLKKSEVRHRYKKKYINVYGSDTLTWRAINEGYSIYIFQYPGLSDDLCHSKEKVYNILDDSLIKIGVNAYKMETTDSLELFKFDRMYIALKVKRGAPCSGWHFEDYRSPFDHL